MGSVNQITGQALRRALALGQAGTIGEVRWARLRDRDYESRSTGDRLAEHAEVPGDGRRIVCDCADLEPGVEIARLLLASQPGPIVEGALIAAFASGSREVVFYVSEDDESGAQALTAVQNDMASEGVHMEVIRRAFRRSMKGYEEVPTLVLSVETLLNLSKVLQIGADAYRGIGSASGPGTKFFQVAGDVLREGIFELPFGIILGEVVQQTCGGLRQGKTLKAALVGGVHGVCYRAEELDAPLDFDSVRQAGGVIGSGSIRVLTETDCVVDHVRRTLAVSCYETCAACSLGREGAYQLREIVSDATKGKSKGSDLDLLREIGRGMQAGAACVSGSTAANLVLSSLDKFPEEYEAHMKRKACRALVCASYVTFHVSPAQCDGCGECREACPEDAIEGGSEKIHVIDEDSCTKCGRCWEVCNGLRQAVVKAGPIKPRTPKTPIPVGSWNG